MVSSSYKYENRVIGFRAMKTPMTHFPYISLDMLIVVKANTFGGEHLFGRGDDASHEKLGLSKDRCRCEQETAMLSHIRNA